MTSQSIAVALTGTYTLDPAHSRIGFNAKELAKVVPRGDDQGGTIDTERDATDAKGRKPLRAHETDLSSSQC